MEKDKISFWKDRVRKDVTSLLDAPDDVTSDENLMLELININLKAFNYADISLKSSKEFMKNIIKKDGLLLRNAHPEMLKDLELVIPAVRNNGFLFKYLPVEVKGNKQVICAVIASNKGDFLLEAANKIKDNRELMLFAVNCRGTNLMFASDRLKDDKEVVLAAITENWLALGFASDRMKGNLEILTVAILKNSAAIRFANKSLLNERDWARLSLMANGTNLANFPQFSEDEMLAKLALEKNELAYAYLGQGLKKNYEFLKGVIDENYKVFFQLDPDIAKSERLVIATWRSICAAYVKEHGPFLSAITNPRVLKYWEEYKQTENPPSFSRFPDYFEKRLRREYKEKEEANKGASE